jgi:cell wall-associated NlpC family hydrolase
MASTGNAGNARVVGGADLQRTVDSLDRVITKLTSVVQSLPGGVTSLLSSVNTANNTYKGARNIVQDIFQGQRKTPNGVSSYRHNWGNVGGNVTFGGASNHAPTQASNRIVGGMNTGAMLLSTPGAMGTPTPSMSSGSANGGGARFSGRPAAGTAGPAGGAGPPIDLSGVAAGVGGIGKAVDSFKAGAAYYANAGSGSDWAIRRMMMSSGNSYGNVSANAFGPSTGLGGFNSIATSSDDVAGAMMIAQNTVGSSTNRQSPYNNFMRSAAGVGYGNPTLGATAAAQYQAAMYTPRSIQMSAAYGIPTINTNGQRASAGQQAAMLVQRTMGGNTSNGQISTALQTGYGLNASINTLSSATGQDPTVMAQQIRSQAAIANANNMSMSQAGTVLEKAAQGDKASISQATKSGVGTTILQSLKTADAASRKTDQQIMESFSDALNKATGYLNSFTAGINTFLKNTGLDKLIGAGTAIGATVGTATSGPLGVLGTVPSLIGMAFDGNSQASAGPSLKGEGLPMVAAAPSSNTTKAAPKGPAPGAGSTAQRFIDASKKYLGQPYVFGGLDCSGLVMYAYKAVTGKTLYHGATKQYEGATPVPKGSEQPGDTVYWEASTGRNGYKHHTAIYLGGGKIIAAPQTGENVKIQNLWGDYQFGRLPGIGGAVTGGNQNAAATAQDTSQTNQGGDTGAGQAGAIGSLGDVYGSTSEYDALAAALAGGDIGNAAGPNNTNKTSQTNTPVGSSTGDSGAGTSNVTGSNAALPANASKAQLQAMVKGQMAGFGWKTGTQWNDINYIVEHESSWNPKSVNSIGAYGLFQAYPGSKMAAYGKDWQTNPVTQTKFGLNYIKSRYGSPEKAQAFWAKNHWYDNGAWDVPDTGNALLHKGEMVIPKGQAKTVRDALLNSIIPSSSGGGSGGGVTIVFDKDSINVHNASAIMNNENIRNLAREIAQQTSQDDRIKSIAKGN